MIDLSIPLSREAHDAMNELCYWSSVAADISDARHETASATVVALEASYGITAKQAWKAWEDDTEHYARQETAAVVPPRKRGEAGGS